jgi:hypothetical protein
MLKTYIFTFSVIFSIISSTITKDPDINGLNFISLNSNPYDTLTYIIYTFKSLPDDYDMENTIEAADLAMSNIHILKAKNPTNTTLLISFDDAENIILNKTLSIIDLNVTESIKDGNLQYRSTETNAINSHIYSADDFLNAFAALKLGNCLDVVANALKLTMDEMVIREVAFVKSSSNPSHSDFFDIITDVILERGLNVAVFDKRTGGKINTFALCNEHEFLTKYPIGEQIDYDKYKTYKVSNIDIYNITDPFYTDICFKFTDSEKHADIPRTFRREYLKVDIAITCGQECVYQGIDNENYILCKCPSTVSQTQIVKVSTTIDETNEGLIRCFPNLILNREEIKGNLAVYIFSFLLGSYILSLIIVVLRDNNKERILYFINRYQRSRITVSTPEQGTAIADPIELQQINIEVPNQPVYDFNPGDMFDLTPTQILERDNRPQCQFIKDFMVSVYTLSYTFYYYTIFKPSFIRISILFIRICTLLLTDALLTGDSLIYDNYDATFNIVKYKLTGRVASLTWLSIRH